MDLSDQRVTRDPFDDDGAITAKHAADMARLLVEHARQELAAARQAALSAEIEAWQAADRLKHATRLLRHWTLRTERAVGWLCKARDATRGEPCECPECVAGRARDPNFEPHHAFSDLRLR